MEYPGDMFNTFLDLDTWKSNVLGSQWNSHEPPVVVSIFGPCQIITPSRWNRYLIDKEQHFHFGVEYPFNLR